MGTIANFLAPILAVVKTGQPRKYCYLHVAVYAGKHDGQHYVIENGGTLGQEPEISETLCWPI